MSMSAPHLPTTRHCFVVVHMDTAQNPPRIKGADLYSESALSLTGAIGLRVFAFDVASATGNSYEDARDNALRELVFKPLHWVRPLLASADRVKVAAFEREELKRRGQL